MRPSRHLEKHKMLEWRKPSNYLSTGAGWESTRNYRLIGYTARVGKRQVPWRFLGGQVPPQGTRGQLLPEVMTTHCAVSTEFLPQDSRMRQLVVPTFSIVPSWRLTASLRKCRLYRRIHRMIITRSLPPHDHGAVYPMPGARGISSRTKTTLFSTESVNTLVTL